MKNFVPTILLTLLMYSCATTESRYLLQGNNSEFLLDIIQEARVKNLCNETPLLVINGIPYRYEYELKLMPLKLEATQIKEIDILQNKMAMKIYGNHGKFGAVIIKTELSNIPNSNLLTNKDVTKTVYDINGKSVHYYELN
jgi:hypothetical protein